MRARGLRERVAPFDLIMIEGAPERLPHVAAALLDAGFYPDLRDGYSRDMLRQGSIRPATPEPRPPLPGLRVLHVVLAVGEEDESRTAGYILECFGRPVSATYEQLRREPTAGE